MGGVMDVNKKQKLCMYSDTISEGHLMQPILLYYERHNLPHIAIYIT